MKRCLFLTLLLAALVAPSGAAPSPGAAPTAGTEAGAPATAVCAVCGVREKAGPEPVAATFEYQGKTYSFCKQACKEEFRLDPERWIRAAAEPAAAHEHTAKPRTGATAVPT